MAEQIVLTGSFRDEITPKLKKLNKELLKVTKTFSRFGRELSKVADKAEKATRKIDRLNDEVVGGMRRQARSVGTSAASWDRYTRSVKSATRAANEFRAPKPGVAPRPIRGGGRRRGGFTQQRMSGKGGFGSQVGTIALGGALGGGALIAASAAFAGASSALGVMANSAVDFQSNVLNLESTLNVVGGLDLKTSEKEAQNAMDRLTEIATALPGDTADYLTVYANTLDDQIMNLFGSTRGALDNLKLGDRSFTALFGLATTGEGIEAGVASRDLTQLAQNPTRINQVTFLKQNATLQKLYLENLESGMKPLEALYKALGQAYPQSRVDKMRKSLASQFETLRAAFFDPKKGIFGAVRKVRTSFGKTSFVDELGKFMKTFSVQVEKLKASGLDPLRLLLTVMNAFGRFTERLGEIVSRLRSDVGERMMTALEQAIFEFTDAVVAVVETVVVLFGAVEDLLKATGLVGDEFSILEGLIFALRSPFTMLKLGLLGVTEALLMAKARLGLASKDEKLQLERVRKERQEGTAEMRVDSMRALGMSDEQIRKAIGTELAALPEKRIIYGFENDKGEKSIFGNAQTKIDNPDRIVPELALQYLERLTEPVNKLGELAEAAKSSFDNNIPFKGEDGKTYGWAQKDGSPVIVEWGTVAGDATAAIPQTPDPVPQLQKLTSSTDEVKNKIVTTGKASESKLSEVSTKLTASESKLAEVSQKLTAPLSVKVESLAVLRMENHPGLTNLPQEGGKKHVAYAYGAGSPAFFTSQREAVSWERMMAPSDSRIASITSNSSEFGGNNVSNNYNVSISIDGAGMNEDQIANTVADKFLSAIRRASYSELDLT